MEKKGQCTFKDGKERMMKVKGWKRKGWWRFKDWKKGYKWKGVKDEDSKIFK